MGIFKSFKKILKKAAPIIGGTIGFSLGGPLGGSLFAGLGTGIGSLVAGADPDDALRNALIGGIGAYAGSKFFGPGSGSAGADAATASSGTQAVSDSVIASGIDSAAPNLASSSIPKFVPAPDPSFFQKAVDFAKTGPGMATIGGIGTLAALGEEPKQETFTSRPDPVGKSRLGVGFIGDKSYNLDDDEDRKRYFDDLRKQEEDRDRVGIMAAADGGSVNKAMGGTHRFYNFPTDTLQYIANNPKAYTEFEQRMAANILDTRPPIVDPMQAIGAPDGSGGMMNGGEVNGPGTGTSDSVPARLSDGEFVLTAKAVRGAGNGDRDIGAARMYEMMSELERVA